MVNTMLQPHVFHCDPTHWKVDPNTGVIKNIEGPVLQLFPLGIEIVGPILPFTKMRLRIQPGNPQRQVLPDTFPSCAVFIIDRDGEIVSAPMSGQGDETSIPKTLDEYIMRRDMVLTVNPAHGPHVEINRDEHRVLVIFETEYGVDCYGGMRVLSVDLS